MTTTPFLSAPLIVQLHALAAVIALGLGPLLIARRKRDTLHRALGYVWVLAMGGAALSSFGIHDFAVLGPFSPIHLLAVLALWSIWVGLRTIWRGDVEAHRHAMRSLYWRGVLVAAAFNFLPGRVVNRTFFDDARAWGFVPMALILALILWDLWRGRQGRALLA